MELIDYNEELIINKSILEMITVAHEYCMFFENSEKHTSNDILNYFQKIAPLLYIKGAILPRNIQIEPEYADRWLTEEKWEELFKALREKFAERDIYYTHDHNFDSVQSSLAENMADIYQDMKDFVSLYQKGPIQCKACAVAELRSLFENHWGSKIINALGAIHYLLFPPIIHVEEE